MSGYLKSPDIDPINQALWPALADLLSLVFIREQPHLFLSPYQVWRVPDDLNMASQLVVVGIKPRSASRRRSAARSSPGLNSTSYGYKSGADEYFRNRTDLKNEGAIAAFIQQPVITIRHQ